MRELDSSTTSMSTDSDSGSDDSTQPIIHAVSKILVPPPSKTLKRKLSALGLGDSPSSDSPSSSTQLSSTQSKRARITSVVAFSNLERNLSDFNELMRMNLEWKKSREQRRVEYDREKDRRRFEHNHERDKRRFELQRKRLALQPQMHQPMNLMKDAVTCMQDFDYDLSAYEQVTLIDIFRTEPESAQIYLELRHIDSLEVRKLWTKRKLSKAYEILS